MRDCLFRSTAAAAHGGAALDVHDTDRPFFLREFPNQKRDFTSVLTFRSSQSTSSWPFTKAKMWRLLHSNLTSFDIPNLKELTRDVLSEADADLVQYDDVHYMYVTNFQNPDLFAHSGPAKIQSPLGPTYVLMDERTLSTPFPSAPTQLSSDISVLAVGNDLGKAILTAYLSPAQSSITKLPLQNPLNWDFDNLKSYLKRAINTRLSTEAFASWIEIVVQDGENLIHLLEVDRILRLVFLPKPNPRPQHDQPSTSTLPTLDPNPTETRKLYTEERVRQELEKLVNAFLLTKSRVLDMTDDPVKWSSERVRTELVKLGIHTEYPWLNGKMLIHMLEVFRTFTSMLSDAEIFKMRNDLMEKVFGQRLIMTLLSIGPTLSDSQRFALQLIDASDTNINKRLAEIYSPDELEEARSYLVREFQSPDLEIHGLDIDVG